MRSARTEVCIACKSPQYRQLYALRGYTLLQCTRCGLAWLLGNAADLPELYSEKYFVGDTPEGYGDYFALKRGLQKTFAKRIEKLKRLGLGEKSSLLEIGCGPGLFLELARRHFGEVSGIEISDFAATYAQEHLGLNVLNEPFGPGAFPGKVFDAIVFWDVIEHLPDPHSALCEVRRLLRVGGHCMFTTGNLASVSARLFGAHWHLLNVPEHLFYFTPESVRHLLHRCGLRTRNIRADFSYYPIFYLVERLSKTAFSRWNYRNPDWLVRLASLPVPINLWDIMTVHGTRED